MLTPRPRTRNVKHSGVSRGGAQGARAQGGGVTPIGAVSRAATGIKMRSNGQGTFWGSVKRSSSVLGTIKGTTGDQEAWPILLRMRS